jgi:RimJ/RimL family protein N-acetyltransferase
METIPTGNEPADDQAQQGRCPIPTLTTERLVLRAFAADDLEPYAAMNADPEMMRYVGGPIDRAATWRLMAMLLGHWDLRGYGMWAMIERASGQFIGRAGLYDQEGWPGLEVAWTVARDRWGRGYATEAGRAALDYAFEVVGADRVISIMRPDNAASIRVAEKIGETFQSSMKLHGEERVVYGLLRSKWRSLANGSQRAG